MSNGKVGLAVQFSGPTHETETAWDTCQHSSWLHYEEHLECPCSPQTLETLSTTFWGAQFFQFIFRACRISLSNMFQGNTWEVTHKIQLMWMTWTELRASCTAWPREGALLLVYRHEPQAVAVTELGEFLRTKLAWHITLGYHPNQGG